MALSALSGEERQRLLLSVGTHRGQRPLTPFGVALLLEKAINGGDTLSSCAEAVHLDGTSQVSRFLALLRLPPDLQEIVDWGRADVALPFTAAFELSRLEGADDQRVAATAILEHSFSTSEVRQLVQARQRSGKSMAECVSSVLKMRPKVEVRHVFVGAVLDDAVRLRLQQMSQMDRDTLLRKALRTEVGTVGVSGRLGIQHFTLAGAKEFGALVAQNKETLQVKINNGLREGLS